MMVHRALPTVALIVLLAIVSVVALGMPDPGLAAAFFTGGYPSLESAVAVVSLLCYAAVAVMGLTCLVQALRTASVIQQERRRTARAAMFLITGAIVLTLSVAHRSVSHNGFCCGDGPHDIQEAASLAR